MIRVLPCLFVANFALVSSADLSDRVVDFGTVRAGTDLCKYISLLSDEPVLSAEIDFGCTCGSASFIKDGKGSGLYLRYAPSLRDGPFVKRLEVKVSTAASGEPETIPILLKGNVWLPVKPSASYLTINTDEALIELVPNNRISNARIVSISLSTSGIFSLHHPQLPCELTEKNRFSASIMLSDVQLSRSHFDSLAIRYTFIENGQICDGHIKIPVFFQPPQPR